MPRALAGVLSNQDGRAVAVLEGRGGVREAAYSYSFDTDCTVFLFSSYEFVSADATVEVRQTSKGNRADNSNQG